MSVTDCLTEAGVSKDKVHSIRKQIDAEMAKNGGDEVAASAAVKDQIDGTFRDYKRGRLLGELKMHQVDAEFAARLERSNAIFNGQTAAARKWDKLTRRAPTALNEQRRFYNDIDYYAKAKANSYVIKLADIFHTLTTGSFKLSMDGRNASVMVRAIIDGNVENLANSGLREGARAITKLFADMRGDFQNLGGVLGYRKNYFPVRHNASAIEKAGYETWAAAYKNAFDIDDIALREGKTVDDVLKGMWASIQNGSANTATKMLDDGIEKSRGGVQALFARHDRSRLADPRSGEAFVEYNRQFGTGDEGLMDMVVQYTNNLGHDIGVMQRMGPTPQRTHNRLRLNAQKEGASGSQLTGLDGAFRTLLGQWETSSDTLLGSVVQGGMHLASAAFLGSAPVAALTDSVFIRNTAKMAGLTEGAGLDRFLKILDNDPDSMFREHQHLAAMSNSLSNRFGGVSEGVTGRNVVDTLSKFSKANHRLSGLDRMTLVAGDAISLALTRNVTELAARGTPFESVSKDFVDMMESVGMTKADYDELVRIGADPNTGMITPRWVAEHDDVLGTRFSALELKLRGIATNAPDLLQRNRSTGAAAGATERGGVLNLMSSAMFQFKSFPIMVFSHHLQYAMNKAMNGSFNALGNLVLLGGTLGVGVVQIKQLIAGRNPKALDDPSLYLNALWQAGSLGLFSDVLLRDPDAYKRNLVAELAGPLASMSGETTLNTMSYVYSAFASASDDTIDMGKETSEYMRALRRNMPFGSLWYAKTAVDRVVMDEIDSALNDESHKRVRDMINRANRDKGTGYWLPPEG